MVVENIAKTVFYDRLKKKDRSGSLSLHPYILHRDNQNHSFILIKFKKKFSL